MKRHILTLLACLFVAIASFNANAQSENERKAWFDNMIQNKIDFIAKQLSLSDEQKVKFGKLYKEMSNETSKLIRDTRALEKSVCNKKNASDIELEKAAEAMAEFKAKEGNIELKYFNQYKTILSSNQLFKLKIAENDWMKRVMRHRNKAK